MGPRLTVAIDVTDTIATRWRAGIQRVVVQLIGHLGADERLDVVPVVWLESCRSFRRLTAAEAARLAPEAPPAPPPARSGSAGTVEGATAIDRLRQQVARARPVLGRLRRCSVGLLVALGIEPVLRTVRRQVLARTRDRALVPLAFGLPVGSVLLELDTVWNNTWVDRGELYADLQEREVHVAAMVYDLLPQTHPEWFEESLVAVSDRTMAAQARSAEVLFAISGHTSGELSSWASGQGIEPVTPVVVPLGADGSGAPTPAGLPPDLQGVTFVLAVGTIEPRKNHAVLLDAFECWIERHSDLHLVVVGRPGWRDDEVVARLDAMAADARTRDRLHWRRAAGDDELAALYQAALVVAVPAVTEGFGLPVIEALAHGTPVVASTGGALPEAGGDIVDHLPPHDPVEWVAAITRHVDDADHHAARRRDAAAFQPPRWADTASAVADVLVDAFAREN